MANRNRNILPNNLAQLQNLIKRDPESYKEEFLQQWKHFLSNLEIFKLDPTQDSEAISSTTMFIAQVSNFYEDDCSQFPMDIVDLLSQHYSVMNSDIRMTLCKALMLLRNKNLIPSINVLQLFYRLLNVKDKLLRKTLYNYIVTDIKNLNSKHKNNKVNTTLQNYMFSMITDNQPTAAKMSVDIMIDLYRRNIWHDTKTVNVLVLACYSKITKVAVAALTFFLGSDTPADVKDSDSESEDENETARKLLVANQVSKKTGKKARKLEKALTLLRKSKKKQKAVSFNFSAIHLINDPQGFAEKLFKQLEHSNERFEVKIMMMNLIARLVGIHELILLNFYPYLQRFLQPHQREVTKLLMFAAQSSHEIVPPDCLQPVLMTIANNFVSERNSAEVMAVGLNAIREICSRAPLAMTEELLQDLVQYKNSKIKTVMMAARSLMQLYRHFDSSLLNKKDRGKPMKDDSTFGLPQNKEYGATTASTFVPGADLLETDQQNIEKKEDEWETDEEDNDSEDGEWIDISHSEDEGSDGDDDENDDNVDGEENEGEDSNEDKDEPEDAVDAVTKAEIVSQTRILTDADFKKIKQQSMSDQINGPKKKGKKRKQDSTTKAEDSKSKSEIVSLSEIENVCKKMRHDKESRLATVLEGRKGREKFGQTKQKRQNEFASTTNKEKMKKKPFMMISHSKKSRMKGKKSFREKQIALRDALIKKEKAGKRH